MSVRDNIKAIEEKLPQGVSLVAVSKFHGPERILEAYSAGLRIFAESRPQEFAAKVPQLPADIEWHFIGHLQTNKLKLVLPYAKLIQSVDSFHLLEAIDSWAVANGRVVDVLLELHLGAEETKQGFSEEEIIRIVSETSSFPEMFPGIRIRGLMGMATNTDDMTVVEKDFERIEALFNRIRAFGLEGFDQLSIGMSADWPVAVRHGATMVRIGTDIFGPREY